MDVRTYVQNKFAQFKQRANSVGVKSTFPASANSANAFYIFGANQPNGSLELIPAVTGAQCNFIIL